MEKSVHFTQRYSNNFLLIFGIVAFVLTIVRLVLGLIVPVGLLTTQAHDDALLFQYADNLLSFNWLGDYNSKTLVKGVSYSLFLALCNWLHLPYTLGLGFMNVGSALLMVVALKKRFQNKIALGCIYLLLLYAPFTYSSLVGLRAYRMAIVPFAVLILFGCLVGLYLRKEERPKSLLPWSIGAGISMGFFWFIREDSIWILPFVAVVLLIMAICVIKEKAEIGTKVKKLILTIVPVLFLVASILVVCCMNFVYYGVFTTNDRSSGAFGKMMGYLYSIEDEDASAEEWVSHAVLESAMDVSPTLASIEPEIETYYAAWSGGNPIKGDIVAWALRDAAEAAGYYQNAVETEAFFAQVNQELEQAFEDGRLQKDNSIHFSNSAEGIQLEQIPDMLSLSIKQMAKMSLFYDTETGIPYSNGTLSQIGAAETLTRTSAVYQPLYQMTLNGTLTSKTDGAFSAEILDETGALLQEIALPQDGGNSYHFSLHFENLTGNQLQIRVYQNQQLVDAFAADSHETDLYSLQLEKTEQVTLDPQLDQVTGDIEIFDGIGNIYRTVSPVVDIFALLGYIMEVVFLFVLWKQKQPVWPEVERWLIVTGFALSAFVLIFGVEFFCGWLDEKVYISFYACGAYVLLMLVKYLSIYLGVQSIWKICKQNRESSRKLQKKKQNA